MLETHLRIHVLEINRRQVQYLSPDDWRRISRPDDIYIENTRAVVASSGTNKLLIRACRNNYIPFCNDKCAKVVLRLEVAAEGLYEIKARVGDDDSEFKIIDVRSGSIAAGPVKVESYCTNVFSQP